MLDISYELSDKRKYYRLTTPLKVQIDGVEHKTLDWSVNAFRIGGYEGSLEVNDEVNAVIGLNFQGFCVNFEQKIRVKRVNLNRRTLVAEYVGPSSRTAEILAFFSKKIITGEFQQFDEVIKHIDIPVTDDYMRASFEPPPEFNQKRANIIAFSLIIGIIAILTVFKLFYNNFFLTQVDSGVVTSASEVVNSPSKGVITDIYVQKGKSIPHDKPIFRVFNPETEREISDKKIQILKRKAVLEEKQQAFSVLTPQIERFIRAQELKINNLEDELAKKTLLYRKKMVSKPEIDELKGKILQLQQDITLKKMEIDSLTTEISGLEGFISIDRQDLEYSEAISGKNTFIAPFPAVIEDIFAFKGKYVDEKTPVVLLKNTSSAKFIESFPDIGQAHRLKLNSRVNIEIPLHNLTIKGTLTRLEKEDDRIKATVMPDKPDILDDIALETPVKVTFIRPGLL